MPRPKSGGSGTHPNGPQEGWRQTAESCGRRLLIYVTALIRIDGAVRFYLIRKIQTSPRPIRSMIDLTFAAFLTSGPGVHIKWDSGPPTYGRRYINRATCERTFFFSCSSFPSRAWLDLSKYRSFSSPAWLWLKRAETIETTENRTLILLKQKTDLGPRKSLTF